MLHETEVGRQVQNNGSIVQPVLYLGMVSKKDRTISGCKK
jgi:hypothetical protein